MEALKKQATKLRDQVSKQHQAVMKQFSIRSPTTSAAANHQQEDVPPSLVDEAELECHQKLHRLYSTTRAAKHLQRNIARGIEGLIAVSSKQMDIVKKLAEDCCNYGNENQHYGLPCAKISLNFGTLHHLMENEREHLLKVLAEQVFEPLREMIVAAPLEDARLLTYRYQQLRQDVECQVADVVRRQLKSNEAGVNADHTGKLQSAESKLSILQATLKTLGKEATAAMISVEEQQQKVIFERLLVMVDAERAFHQNVATILDKLYEEMVLAKQKHKPLSESLLEESAACSNNFTESTIADESTEAGMDCEASKYFVAEVVHPFVAQSGGELSLSTGDYVVVRQVSTNGWSEGECRGNAGWFPSAYVELREKAPASKVIEHLLTEIV